MDNGRRIIRKKFLIYIVVSAAAVLSFFTGYWIGKKHCREEDQRIGNLLRCHYGQAGQIVYGERT